MVIFHSYVSLPEGTILFGEIPEFLLWLQCPSWAQRAHHAQRPRCSWRVASVVRRWFLAPRKYWSAVPRPGKMRKTHGTTTGKP